jgi:hypothetical protein
MPMGWPQVTLCNMWCFMMIHSGIQIILRYYLNSSRSYSGNITNGRDWFAPGSGQVGFVVDKMALGQVFSEYFGFSCQSSFHQLLHNHSHLSSGAVQ